ncbi:hypothetical protein [Lactiplantibacillus pentosus]|uniref:hypothetical protein n=1 Tax=Lactiplantibacillus pentosus TaxID=1589 RepID=UPI0021820ABC|nr:hypothetical protein [Lactiplantibacillus pentosus]MCS8602902.1 hypothetical protein [Lactiplantibacillus pentosus]
MEDNEGLALTNYIDFEFDRVGFNRQFRLCMVTTTKPQDLSDWFVTANALAISKQPEPRFDQSGNDSKENRYLMLTSREETMPENTDTLKREVLTLEQAMRMGISDDEILLMLMKCRFQGSPDSDGVWRNQDATSRLYLTKEGWFQVTKADIPQQETKDNTNQQETKDDANQQETEDDTNQQETKDDANQQETEDDTNQQVTKDNANQQVTKSDIYQQVALEVSIKHHILNLASRTFTEVDGYQGYVVCNDCMKFKKREQQRIFSVVSVNKKKNNTIFFSTQADEFERAKVSNLNKLITAIGVQYATCFKIIPTFHACLSTEFVNKKKVTKYKEQRILEQLGTTSINIMIDSKSKQQAVFAASFATAWRQTEGLANIPIDIIDHSATRTGLNIQVLNDLNDDQYQVSTPTRIIQHLIYANFVKWEKLKPKPKPKQKQTRAQGKEQTKKQMQEQSQERKTDNKLFLARKKTLLQDSRMRTMLSQLLIKQDIMNGNMCFPTEEEVHTAAQFRYYATFDGSYYRLEVTPSGQLNCVEVTEKTIGQDDKLKQIIKLLKKPAKRRRPQFTKIIESDSGQLYGIEETALRTIPNIEEIERVVALANANNRIRRQSLVKVANQLDDSDLQVKQILLSKIDQVNIESLSIGHFQTILKSVPALNWRPKLMQNFNQNFYDETHAWLYSPIKRKAYDSWWNGIYGIGLLMLNGEHYYYVGLNQLIDQRLSRSVSLRKIVAIGSDQPEKDISQIMPKLARLMDSGYVRDGQYTVVPFPFKYIKEVAELNHHGAPIKVHPTSEE